MELLFLVLFSLHILKTEAVDLNTSTDLDFSPDNFPLWCNSHPKECETKSLQVTGVISHRSMNSHTVKLLNNGI
ncbi:carbonic anhydrase 4 [Grus japonensis]|uniref:Carbonic anhydrase 4 n=1 Tax=Grus japonensis TaxID=30415 RepID=A0ABC9XKK0_GRUJA